MEVVENVRTKTRADLDGAWKEILRKYFKDFVLLCWPQIFDKIDWSRGYRFLEQEFHAVLNKGEINKRSADKLIEIWLKDGTGVWALIHLEVEGGGRQDFPERIYIYRYKIFDVHKKDIATLAILIDGDKKWRPNVYETTFWGTHLRLEYPILKILDFKERKTDLEQSQNPFAFVILAQLAAIETAGTGKTRLATKFELTKSLYSLGLPKSEVLDVLRFLAEVIVLPPDLKLEYQYQVKNLEKELKVSYMTHIEKEWLQQGIEQGIEKGKVQGRLQGFQEGESMLLLELLKSKFKIEMVPVSYARKILTASPTTLLAWSLRVLNSRTIKEVFNGSDADIL